MGSLKRLTYFVVFVLCTNVDVSAGKESSGKELQYRRLKRAKYYGAPRRSPSLSQFFSYTPPPDYMLDVGEYPTPPSLYRPAFGPPDGPEAAVDTDIAALVRSLSKHDLDKIVEYAAEKNGRVRPPNAIAHPPERHTYPRTEYLGEHLPEGQEGRAPPMARAPPYEADQGAPRPSAFSADSSDFDISYTRNVEAIIKPMMLDYKLENFGDLPLTNDDSKIKSADSYNVPHYTVTSIPGLKESNEKSTREKRPLYEAATATAAAEAARAHSDAHLKAVKIWTHRSVGAAYTVRADGTLAPERPLPQPSRQHP